MKMLNLCINKGKYSDQYLNLHWIIGMNYSSVMTGHWLGSFLIYLFIYGCVGSFCCCSQTFSSCREQGLLFTAVQGLLIAVASLVPEHGL